MVSSRILSDELDLIDMKPLVLLISLDFKDFERA